VFSREQNTAVRSGRAKRPLYAVSRIHLDSMTSALGVWQHATGTDPNPRFGHCTDDVARAIVVDMLHSRELGLEAVEASAARSLRFMQEAFDHSTGRFLNFRDADGLWHEADASEDCHARALVGFAAVMVERPGTDMADRARRLFLLALPAAAGFDAIRPISAALIGCDMVASADLAAEAKPAFDRLAGRLIEKFGDPGEEWPWPDQVLTYENALVARGLITAGRRLGNQPLVARGCAVLDWLIDVQTEGGIFSPIGNSRWWPRGGKRSRFDQQPIEAATMIDAAAAAFRATGRRRYVDAAEMAYGWFLGDNDLGISLANPAGGGCCDGLMPSGVNENQGGESTLMWLTALETMRELRCAATGRLDRSAGVQSAPVQSSPTGSSPTPGARA
jgi:hypothetical protein